MVLRVKRRTILTHALHTVYIESSPRTTVTQSFSINVCAGSSRAERGRHALVHVWELLKFIACVLSMLVLDKLSIAKNKFYRIFHAHYSNTEFLIKTKYYLFTNRYICK